VPDDLDLLELPAEPPAASGAAPRRRLRAGMVAVAAAVVTAAAAATLATGHDHHRTDIDDRPAPAPPDVIVAPAPGPDGGAASPSAPARRPAPVVETLALRADGGIGTFAAGAPSDAVVAAVTAALGRPAADATGRLAAACSSGPTRLPAGAAYRLASWGDLSLTFAGPSPADERLVAWTVRARPDADRSFRLAGGPAFDAPLAAWGAAYGSAVQVGRLSGDRGQSLVTVRLPAGEVTLVGYAPASANAVVARGGAPCVPRQA